jgi:predicted Zn-dependent protease
VLGPDRAQAIAEQVMGFSQADQTEVLIQGQDSALTRFANSVIHQNVAETNVVVQVRVVYGQQVGVASTNRLPEKQGDEALRGVVATASQIARLLPPNPEFPGLPAPQPVPSVTAFAAATAQADPIRRAEAVGTICRLATESGLMASGAFSTDAYELAVANSRGVWAYHPATLANLSTVIMSDDSSGWAQRSALDVNDVDAEAAGREAVNKALHSKHPVAIEPGEYTVILEEYAVATMIGNLSYMGFSAQAVQEGRSFMGGHFGEQLAGSQVSIWDDGRDPTGLPVPFDFEGVPKRRVDFFDHGVARAVVYDSYTASKEPGQTSTGHALPAGFTWGPLPLNLFLAPGTATKEEMLRGTDRGLWVTRFHYTNPVHPLMTILTGMTRDGTFLIEHGEIARPVKNLRFTQSVLAALNSVEAIGRETVLLGEDFFGASRVPALKVGRFRFSGATEF